MLPPRADDLAVSNGHESSCDYDLTGSPRTLEPSYESSEDQTIVMYIMRNEDWKRGMIKIKYIPTVFFPPSPMSLFLSPSLALSNPSSFMKNFNVSSPNPFSDGNHTLRLKKVTEVVESFMEEKDNLRITMTYFRQLCDSYN